MPPVSRTVAVSRYLAADLVRSQRFLMPVFAYLVLLVVLVGGQSRPPPASWAWSAGLLYPISVWLAVTVANAEDPAQRHVTVAAAGGWARMQLGVLGTCLACDAVLVVLAVLRPLVPLGGPAHPIPASVLLLGVLAHLASATTGTSVGLLCARPLVRRPGWALLAACAVTLATGTQPWLPPVGTAIRQLVGADPSPWWLARDTLVGIVLSGLAVVLSTAAGPRRS
jgi:hypothetical protein